jgi:methylmalonyl-CoA/ethylmalonyl-CoA epimerase
VVSHERPAAPVILTAIDHVGLAVPDLDAAIRFHTETLGLRLIHREENREQGVCEAILGAADPASPPVLQLLAAIDEHSPIARFIGRFGSGMHHLAFRVPDVDIASAEFRQRGLQLLYDAGKVGTRGSRINFIHPKDTGGVLIELVEAAGNGGTAESGAFTPSA